VTEIPDTVLAKMLSHPLRAQILRTLAERVASPGELARELNERIGPVSYHVRILVANECVELVRVEPRRGALAHYYRATVQPETALEQWRSAPAEGDREHGRTVQRALRNVNG
jgi:DNA-binding transcriptional ArsR family regulator